MDSNHLNLITEYINTLTEGHAYSLPHTIISESEEIDYSIYCNTCAELKKSSNNSYHVICSNILIETSEVITCSICDEIVKTSLNNLTIRRLLGELIANFTPTLKNYYIAGEIFNFSLRCRSWDELLVDRQVKQLIGIIYPEFPWDFII